MQPNNNAQAAEAIVVLSGGSYFHAPEYAEDTVSAASLQRLRYAAKLYRDFKKPVLLSGGSPAGKQVLEQEFNTPVQWIDDKSDNTLASARFSYHLLQNRASSVFIWLPMPGTCHAHSRYFRQPGLRSFPHLLRTLRAIKLICWPSHQTPKRCTTVKYTCTK